MSIAKQWFDAHANHLNDALAHWRRRDYYASPYPEIPSEKIFGEGSAASGKTQFDKLLNTAFALPQHPGSGEIGAEESPYGFNLGVVYPRAETGELTAACQQAMTGWQQCSVDERAGVLLESMQRLSQNSFCMAHAVMHTTGQGFMMAFQAGAAHALQRGLEAMAVAYGQLQDIPTTVVWEKPQGKKPPLRLQKNFRIMPRGVSLVIACSTFPTWNSYPAIFANLLCGNGVIVKPHPGAILPLALTVRLLRQVLTEAGLDANLVLLAADSHETPCANRLVADSAVRLIDYTGNTVFGNWLEEQARGGVRVFTEKAGVNCAVIDDIGNIEAMAANIAFSFALYSGQMCTTPQNLFVPKKHCDAVCDALQAATDSLLSDDARAVEILGAIQSPATLARRAAATEAAQTIFTARTPQHAQYPQARLAAPLLLRGDADDDSWQREWFGPIYFVIPVADSDTALAQLTHCVNNNGALTAAVYSDNDDFITRAESACAQVGVNVAFNLTGATLVNHSAAFSDMHGTGANAAANAALTDPAYVASRYIITQSRRLA